MFNFKLLSDKSTRVTHHSSTCIDLVFCNSAAAKSIKFCDSIPVSFSDHNLAVCDIQLKRERPKRLHMEKRHVSLTATTAFRDNLNAIYPITFTDVNELADVTLKALMSYDDLFPLRRQLVPDYNISPWITQTILNVINKKEKAYCRFLSTRSVYDRNAFLILKKNVADLCLREKYTYFGDRIKKWKILNSFSKGDEPGENKKTNSIDGTLSSDCYKIANSLNT